MKFTKLSQAKPEHPKKQKRVTTNVQREQYIALWQKSHLSRIDFCKEHHLSKKTFSNWLGRLKGPQNKKNVILPTDVPLVAETIPLNDENYQIKFQLPNQIHITIDGCHNSEFILSIIKGISECKFN